MTFDNRPRLRLIGTLRRTICPDCQQPIAGRHSHPYAVHRGRAVLCDTCVRRVAPQLAAILAFVDPKDDLVDPRFGVAESTLRANTLCAITRQPVGTPRPFELVTGDAAHYLSVLAGEVHARGLSLALHRFYGTTPTPPAPPPPPPPPPETPKERKERERREKHAKALHLIASALGDPRDPHIRNRAASVVEAVQLLTA